MSSRSKLYELAYTLVIWIMNPYEDVKVLYSLLYRPSNDLIV